MKAELMFQSPRDSSDTGAKVSNDGHDSKPYSEAKRGRGNVDGSQQSDK